MARILIDKKERELIRANLDLSPGDIAALIARETGVIVAEASINRYLREYREQAEEEAELSLALIDTNINDYIKQRTNIYLDMLDKNIKEINKMLIDKEKVLVDKDGNVDPDKVIRVSRQLGESISTMLKLSPKPSAPPKPTLNVNITTDLDTIMATYNKSKNDNNTNKEDQKDNVKVIPEEDFKIL